MKTLLFLALIGTANLFAYNTATLEVAETMGIALSAGGYHTCALDDSGIKCWGNNDDGQTNVPDLSHPTQIAVGGYHTCAIDDSGVKCWGRNDSNQTNVPKLSHPTQISAGTNHTCAIDDSGVKCWGNNSYGQTNTPSLSNPAQITAGWGHTCATDVNGVKCWGWNGYKQRDVPKLSHPTQVSAGMTNTCALDDSGVKCWGNNEDYEINIPKLSHPTQVSVGMNNTCTIDDSGVKCWKNNKGTQTENNVPSLLNPTLISSGGNHTCTLDDSGVKCWGNNNDGQINVPDQVFNLGVIRFLSITNLGVSLEKLSKKVYQEKSIFLKSLSPLATKLKASSALEPNYIASTYLFYSLQTFVSELSADKMTQLKEKYSFDILSLQSQGYHSLNDFRADNQIIKVSLSISHAALNSLKAFATNEQQTAISQLETGIARALASTNPNTELAPLLTEYKHAESLLNQFTESHKTRAFALILQEQMAFLEGVK